MHFVSLLPNRIFCKAFYFSALQLCAMDHLTSVRTFSFSLMCVNRGYIALELERNDDRRSARHVWLKDRIHTLLIILRTGSDVIDIERGASR